MASSQLLAVRAGWRFTPVAPQPSQRLAGRMPDPSQRWHSSPSCRKHSTCSGVFGILVVVMGVFASLVRASVLGRQTHHRGLFNVPIL